MQSPPVILQVLPRLQSGGVERGTVEITEAIVAAGMKAIVASNGGMLSAKVVRAGGTHITLPLDSKNPFIMYQNAWALYRLIQTQGVSLIHARSRAPAWSAYYAAKWAKIPLLTTFHGIYGNESKFKRRYNRIMVAGALVIAVSNFVKNHILHEYNVDSDRIRLIPRGVDFALFDEKHVMSTRVAELIKSWRLPEEQVPILFCPGRLSRIKGQHLLVEALAQLKDMHFLCILAGNDDGHETYREELEELIVRSGLEGKVRITGHTNYMTEAYTLSQLVIVPSIKPESFGRIAIEAQAMERLVIATDHGGARETIINNETGYLVPTENPTAMAEAIRYALELEEPVRAAMGTFAKSHVHKHFSSEQMKQKTIAVYKELLSKNQPIRDEI